MQFLPWPGCPPRAKKRIMSKPTFTKITPPSPITSPVIPIIIQQINPIILPLPISPITPPIFSFSSPPCKYFSDPEHGTSPDNRDDFFGDINFRPDPVNGAPETHTDELPDIYLHPAHYTNRLPRVNLIDVGQADVAPPQDGNLNLWRDISYHLSLFQQQNVPITPSTQQFVITTVEVAPHTQQIVHTVADVLHDPLLCPPGTEPNKFDFDFPPVLNTFKPEPLLKDTQSPQLQKDGANFNRILKAIRSAEKSKKTVTGVIAV